MTAFVLDCSIAISWCLHDEQDEYARRVLESLDTIDAIVPALWKIEVVNVMLTATKKKRVTEAEVAQFFSLLNKLPIQVIENDLPQMNLLMLSQKHDLTAYDGVYLELCLRYGYPLATNDQKLANSLKDAGGVLYLR
jgi:predicted nucleic acid-binding protein